MSATLEIACFSPEDAVVAGESGAHRIEFCREYDVGGLTPSLADFAFVRERVDVPVFVMIRERAGDFVFGEDGHARMRTAARELLEAGADGIVFGALTTDGRVDEPSLKYMVDVVSPKPLTFHRAFDEAADSIEAMDALMRCGAARVLTSGVQPTALEGAEMLARLIERAGADLIVVPGGGVRSYNVEDLLDRTGAREVHSAARTIEPIVDPKEVRLLADVLA